MAGLLFLICLDGKVFFSIGIFCGIVFKIVRSIVKLSELDFVCLKVIQIHKYNRIKLALRIEKYLRAKIRCFELTKGSSAKSHQESYEHISWPVDFQRVNIASLF